MSVLCSRVLAHLDTDYFTKVLLYLSLLSYSEPLSEELMAIVTVFILFRPVQELTRVI